MRSPTPASRRIRSPSCTERTRSPLARQPFRDIECLCHNTDSMRDPIPQGTLDMLILQTLARHGEAHGFEVAELIQRGSAEVLQVEEGSLYPALQRLLVQGWVVGEWGRTAENRRARYYKLTV